MAKLLKLRRGSTSQHSSFTGAEGEVTIDTTKDTAVVHDGAQAGGRPLAREDMSNVSSASIAGQLGTDSIATTKIAAGALPSDVTVASANIVDGTFVNAEVNASAAIAGTKISPNFGSQTITTTGSIASGDIEITGTAPSLVLQDSNDENDFAVANNGGLFKVRDVDAGVDRFTITSAGVTSVSGNLDVGAGVDVTGNITATGSVTVDQGAVIKGANDSAGILELHSDRGDDNADKWRFIAEASGSELNVQNYNNGAWQNNLRTTGSAGVDLYHSNGIKASTTSSGLSVTGNIAVTGTVDGRDVAADGTKLDGIESSATADQTAAEIRTLVESASDSNVFTDADHSKLNGIEASATADQTASEIVSLINGQNITPANLEVGTGRIGNDGNDYFTFTNNTRCDLYINGSNEFRFESDGDFHADGDVIAQSTTISSDRRLKENIEVIPNALDKVQALNGVSFDWKKTGEKSAGVIAQEVQGVLPEAVKEVTPVGGGDSHLSVNYHALTSILIESIKELKAEIEELKGGK